MRCTKRDNDVRAHSLSTSNLNAKHPEVSFPKAVGTELTHPPPTGTRELRRKVGQARFKLAAVR